MVNVEELKENRKTKKIKINTINIVKKVNEVRLMYGWRNKWRMEKINRVGYAERENNIEIVNKMGDIIIKEN